MRFWILFFLFICALFAIALVVTELDAPVRIIYAQWQISPPLSVAVVALLLVGIGALIVIRLLFLLLSLPFQVSAWRARFLRKKNEQNLKEALRLMAHNESGKLLKVLSALQNVAPQSAWQCAQLAEQSGDTAGKRKWLQKAADSADTVIATAAKAELCRMQNHTSEAERILKSANALAGPPVLTQTYYAVSKSLGNWGEALRAAQNLRGKNMPGWDIAVAEAVGKNLDALSRADALNDFWKNQAPAAEKKMPKILAHYIARLFAANDEKNAYAQLEQAHKQHPHDAEILSLVVTFGSAALKQSAFAANEKNASVNDIRLLQLLMQLAQQLDLPGKADQYKQMIRSLSSNAPTPT